MNILLRRYDAENKKVARDMGDQIGALSLAVIEFKKVHIFFGKRKIRGELGSVHAMDFGRKRNIWDIACAGFRSGSPGASCFYYQLP